MAAQYIYIGVRKTDGAIRACCCDDVGLEDDTAAQIVGWIKRGYKVERITASEFQKRTKNSGADHGTTRPIDQ